MPKPGAVKKAYNMAKPLPKGVEIDGRWVISEVIGQGGFGRLYCASEKNTPKDAKFVLKIEPQENGPLFTETHFYMRLCKADLLEAWKREHKLSFLGIPRFVGKGSFSAPGGGPCRFLVMDRFEGSLEDSLNKREFTASDLSLISIQVVNALEYIHANQYVHADVKAGNLLKGVGSKQFYLADFGLVTHYTLNGKHKEETVSPKLKDNGTLEFCSRDTHQGLPPSRRGDLEILAFNIVHWLFRSRPESLQTSSAGLPWANHISANRQLTPQQRQMVVSAKEDAMKRPTVFASSAGFGKLPALETFLTRVGTLGYAEKPDYAIFRALLGQLAKETAKTSVKSGRHMSDENQTANQASANELSHSKRKAAARESGSKKDPASKAPSVASKRGRPVLAENDSANRQPSNPTLLQLAVAAATRHRTISVANGSSDLQMKIKRKKKLPTTTKPLPSPVTPRQAKRQMRPEDPNSSSCDAADTNSTPRRNPPRQARRAVHLLPFDRSFDDDDDDAFA